MHTHTLYSLLTLSCCPLRTGWKGDPSQWRGRGVHDVAGSAAPTPEQVRKFRRATRPPPGEKRILHSFVGDAPPNPDLRHGVITKASLEVRLTSTLFCEIACIAVWSVECCSVECASVLQCGVYP